MNRLSLALAAYFLLTAAVHAQPKPATPAAVDQEVIRLQVALDRAGFSSGVIDGRSGANTTRALDAFKAQNNREPDLAGDPLIDYVVTPEDAAGPFVENLPSDLLEQSKLPALSYRGVDEMLAERFHTTPQTLKALNAAATFAAGETIKVPNVEPMAIRPTPPTAETTAVGTTGKAPAKPLPDAGPQVVVRVSRASGSLTATSTDGKVLLFAPVTMGSEHDPLPIGEWKVNGVQYNPTFRYNPELFWDANPAHTKAKIPPGPNGPVGVVWIDISKEHYGLHGSPEPSQIGRSESHGCVRLTNWDAMRLAALVRPGTQVVFTE
jgi:lipoprotein-anchoring transpeptidase ErfK/SrfK